MKIAFPLLIGVALYVAGCGPADKAAAPSITVVNQTGFDVMEVIFVPAGTGEEGRNILPDDSLALGESISCLLPQNPKVEFWDVKTLDADGRETVWTGIVVRADNRLILKMDGQTPMATIE